MSIQKAGDSSELATQVMSRNLPVKFGLKGFSRKVCDPVCYMYSTGTGCSRVDAEYACVAGVFCCYVFTASEHF